MDADRYARWQAARLYWRADGRLTPATIRALTPPDITAQDAALRRMHTAYHRRRRYR